MLITMADVMSINARITAGNEADVRKWASAEDQQIFKELLAEHDVIVMGSRTYDVVRPNPAAGKLYIVMTQNPDRYRQTDQPENVEFASDSPEVLVRQLQDKGCQKLLIAGGGMVNRLFLQAGLVDELCLTIEPALFFEGVGLVADGFSGTILAELLSVSQLNARGTLLLRYALQSREEVDDSTTD